MQSQQPQGLEPGEINYRPSDMFKQPADPQLMQPQQPIKRKMPHEDKTEESKRVKYYAAGPLAGTSQSMAHTHDHGQGHGHGHSH